MKNIGILSVLAVLLVGFGYYTLFATPANETAEQAARDQDDFAVEREPLAGEPEPEPRQGIGTLDELRLLNEDLECTIAYNPNDNGAAVEGTYFVSDGNMRGDFLTNLPDLSGQMLSSMIIDGTTLYIWSEIEEETYGAKMALSALADENVISNEPVALDAAVSYDCTAWENVDNTVFVPPSDTLFQDLDSSIGVGMEYGTIFEAQGEF